MLCLSIALLSCRSIPENESQETPGEDGPIAAAQHTRSTATALPAAADLIDSDNPEQLMSGGPPPPLRSAVAPDKGLEISRSPAPLSAPGISLQPSPSANVLMSTRLENRAPRPDLLRVHALNIGAGSCILVECPGSDDVIVYDCGQMSPSETDLGEDEVRDYFDAVIGSDRPAVVLSHADADHVNLVARVLGDRVPESIWFGGKKNEYRGEIADWFAEHNQDVPTYFGWRRGYGADGEPVEELACGDASAYLLTVNTEPGTNPSSLMLLYEYGGFSVVLAGDAEGASEQRAIDNHGHRLNGVSVVMASHHGARSHDSNHQAWVSKLQPAVVVYSSGTSHGHPKGDVVERYAETVTESLSHDMWDDPETAEEDRYATERSEYVTELNGTIVIETDGESFSVECSRDSTC